MYFDFEDYRPETPTIESAISRREAVVLSVAVHVVLVVAMIMAPRYLPAPTAAELAARQAALERQVLQQQRNQRRFVFVQPRVDLEALRPPDRGDDSDKNRTARAPERAKEPTNPLPFSRGNSPERVEAPLEARARGRGATPDPSREAERTNGGTSLPQSANAPAVAPPQSPSRSAAEARSGAAGGSLGDALRNLERYVQGEQFGNQQGGAGAFGPAIQFDTKGVEFGPWIRRFIAQIKRNWFIPYAAMAMKGHVVVTFYVHKDGSISELAVPGPSSVDAFNNSSFNALASSSPTYPLPPEYPADKAFFTVTFFYNETPPSQ